MSEPRYTDQEVARLLKRAADLDQEAGSGSEVARGLSLADLREVAAEAGIDPAAVTRAAAELATPSTSKIPGFLLGETGLIRRTAAVPGTLDRSGLAHLVSVIDAEAPASGTVGEALGSIRWTATGRFMNRQVVVRPTDTETVVRVEERFTDRLRAIIHILPASYGAGGGVALGAAMLGGGPSTALAALGGTVVGLGLGRALWNGLRARSKGRVERLTQRLAAEASARDNAS